MLLHFGRFSVFLFFCFFTDLSCCPLHTGSDWRLCRRMRMYLSRGGLCCACAKKSVRIRCRSTFLGVIFHLQLFFCRIHDPRAPAPSSCGAANSRSRIPATQTKLLINSRLSPSPPHPPLSSERALTESQQGREGAGGTDKRWWWWWWGGRG